MSLIGFSLDAEQSERYQEWEKEQDAKVRARQLESTDSSTAKMAECGAYYGTIGGGYTFTFTPTGLGTVVKVKNCVTGEELDLTDYDSW